MAETTICKQCVHYLVCMHFSATRKECKQFQANTNHVEVVRCKDCKHWQDIGKGCTDHVRCCEIGFYMIGENGYCYFGERSADNENL